MAPTPQIPPLGIARDTLSIFANAQTNKKDRGPSRPQAVPGSYLLSIQTRNLPQGRRRT
jgi:hypothetical protein